MTDSLRQNSDQQQEPQPSLTKSQMRILAQVNDMLARPTPERITTRMIATHLEMSESVLYRHFSGKEDILATLVRFTQQSIVERLGHITKDADKTALERIAEMTGFVAAFCDKNQGISRLLTREALYPDFIGLEMEIKQIWEMIVLHLRQQMNVGEGASPEQRFRMHPGQGSRLVVWTLEGALQHWIRSRFRPELSELWSGIWPELEEALTVRVVKARGAAVTPEIIERERLKLEDVFGLQFCNIRCGF